MGRKSKFWFRLIIHGFLILGAVITTFPFIWMVLTSLKTFAETATIPPTILPKKFMFSNYTEVFLSMDFLRYFFNSFLVTFFIVGGQLVFCSMAAFAFARLKFKGRDVIFYILLAVLMMPMQIIIMPSYVLMQKLGWIDTYKALIIPGMFSAFGVFLLRQFFMSLPQELEEAALIDGANYFQIFSLIMVPLVKPALIALSIFSTLFAWNNFLWPLIMTNSAKMRVLPVALSTLQGVHYTNYPLLMAGAVLSTLPMIAIFIILQRYFIEGIALTGTKG